MKNLRLGVKKVHKSFTAIINDMRNRFMQIFYAHKKIDEDCKKRKNYESLKVR